MNISCLTARISDNSSWVARVRDHDDGSAARFGVCRKNEFLCANSVMLCVFVVKLPGKTFTTEARSLHREPRRTFSDRLLRGLGNKWKRDPGVARYALTPGSSLSRFQRDTRGTKRRP